MVPKFFLLCATAVMITGCAAQPEREDSQAARAELEQMYAQWGKAFEAKDLDGVMRMYAPGNALTAYDIVPPLKYRGADAYRKDYATLFASFAGSPHVEFPGMHIETGKDVAFVYGLERMTGKLTDGTTMDVWLRYTDGLKRIDGQWRVVHEHVSVPVDMASGKARLDLKP